MNYPAVILILASLVQFFVGSLAYVRDILKGKSKPNRMTFLIWAAGPFIGVPAAIVAGATWWALLPVFMAGLGPCVIFLVSFRNPAGYWKLPPFSVRSKSIRHLCLQDSRGRYIACDATPLAGLQTSRRRARAEWALKALTVDVRRPCLIHARGR